MSVPEFLRAKVGEDLTPAEQRLVREMGEGKLIDYAPGEEIDFHELSHREAAQAWGPERTIRAEVLYWICVHPESRALVHPRGIYLRGARIAGEIDFRGATVLHRLFLRECYVEESLKLSEAHLRTFELRRSYLPRLEGKRLHCEGSLVLEGAWIGPLHCPNPKDESLLDPGEWESRAPLPERPYTTQPEGREVISESKRLDMSDLASAFLVLPSVPLPIDKKSLIEWDYQDLMMDLSAHPALIQLGESKIEGDLNLDAVGAYSGKGLVLYGAGIEINGHLYLRNSHINGILCFSEAQIKQSFQANQIKQKGAEMQKSVFSLIAPRLRVGGTMTLKGGSIVGRVLLFEARVQEELILDEVKITKGEVVAYNLQVIGHLRIRKAEIESGIRLGKSNISGQLIADNVRCSYFHASNLTVRGKLVLRNAEININLGDHLVQVCVDLSEACIGGDIDAEELKAGSSFWALGLKAQGKLLLKKSQISTRLLSNGLNLTKAQINDDLDATAVRIYGDLNASDLKVEGRLVLNGGEIVGHIYLSEAQIGTKLDAKGIKVEGRLTTESLKLRGKLVLKEAQVRGGIKLVKGYIGGDFEAERAKVEEIFDVIGLTIHGSLLLNEAQVGQDFLLIGGQISGRIEAKDVSIGGLFGLDSGLVVQGGLLLENGKVKDITLTSVQIDSVLKAERINVASFQAENIKVQGDFVLEDAKIDGNILIRSSLLNGHLILKKSYIVKHFSVLRSEIRKDMKISNLVASFLIIYDTSVEAKIEIEKSYLNGRRGSELLKDVLPGVCLGMAEISARLIEMRDFRMEKQGEVERVKVREGWIVEGVRWSQGIYWREIEVGGDLRIQRSVIGALPGKPALALPEARIQGRFLVENSVIAGELNMEKAHTGKCEVKNSFLVGERASWQAREAKTGLFALEKSDIMNGLAAENLRADTLRIHYSTFVSCEGAPAEEGSRSSFQIWGAEVKEVLEIQGGRWNGEVDLSFAQIKKIEIHPVWRADGRDAVSRVSWRGPIYSEPSESRLRAEGLKFERFLLHEQAQPSNTDEGQGHTPLLALNWIRRHLPRFTATAYLHLAAALSAEGFEKEATHTLIQQEEDKKAVSGYSLLHRAWHRLLYYTIGHGYRSEWALFWILGFILLGAFLFKLGYETKLIVPASPDILVQQSYQTHHAIPADYPAFHALGYSIDAFIPFLNLMIESYWLPDADNFWGHLLRVYLWIHIGLGWILSTLFVSGITGIIRKLD